MKRRTRYLAPHTIPAPTIGVAYSGLGGAGIRVATEFSSGSSTGGLAEAITNLGSSDGVVYLPPASYPIDADYTIPATAHVIFAKGASCAIATTKTLTINGTIEAGLYQIFSGAGSVVLGSGVAERIPIHWFGDVTGDCRDVIEAALAAANDAFVPRGTYYIDDNTADITAGQTLRVASGADIKRLSARSSATTPLFQLRGSQATLRGEGKGCQIVTENNSPNGIVLMEPDGADTMTYCDFQGFLMTGVKANGNIGLKMSAGSGICMLSTIDNLRIAYVGTALEINEGSNGHLIGTLHLYQINQYPIHFKGGAAGVVDILIARVFIHTCGGANVTCLKMERTWYCEIEGIVAEPAGTSNLYDVDANSEANIIIGIGNCAAASVNNSPSTFVIDKGKTIFGAEDCDISIGGKWSVGPPVAASLVSDAMAYKAGHMTVDTENNDPTDDLTSITGGLSGDILFLRTESSGRDVTVKEGGNIYLDAAGDFVLSSSRDYIVLMRWITDTWNELSRSNNG